MAAKNSLFQVSDYKLYLNDMLSERAKDQSGQRIRLAKHLKCNPSYVSQVLNEHQHLTPEQAISTSEFLGLTDIESHYFLNLVLLARAGTKVLKKYYEDLLNKTKHEYLLLKNRIKANRSLDASDQALYYKVWYHAAIHMIVSLPEFRTGEQIAKALQLPIKTVNQSIEFLISVGLLKESQSKIIPGEKNLLVGADSPFLIRHQTNWRIRALQELDSQNPDHLHYSGVITCSQTDFTLIREMMIKAILEIRSTVKESKDETLAVYNLDVFKLLRP